MTTTPPLCDPHLSALEVRFSYTNQRLPLPLPIGVGHPSSLRHVQQVGLVNY